MYMLDWKNLTQAQKAEAVIMTVQFAVRTLTDLPKFWKMMWGEDPDSIGFKIGCIKWNEGIGEVGGHTVSLIGENAEGEKTVLSALDGNDIEHQLREHGEPRGRRREEPR